MAEVGFRHSDVRFPFFWESTSQPAARWHAAGEGPVQYLADTADGAWAEFLRHEEITDPADLEGIRRRIWAIELPKGIADAAEPDLPDRALLGGVETYQECQDEARRLRETGAAALRAPSAAVLPGSARGQLTRGGLVEASERDGVVWVLFGTPAELRGWATVDAGAPTVRVLSLVRHFGNAPTDAERRSGRDRRSQDRRTQIDLTDAGMTRRNRRGKVADRRRESRRSTR